MSDMSTALSDTHRDVGRKTIAAGEARTALIRRRYDAPIEDIWDTCTNPDRINRWLLPVTGDLRVGGRFSLEGNASGEILRCEPPRLLTVTWVFGDRPADEVELRLFPGTTADTVLELEHATVTKQVEWEGQLFDVILGVGVGWEMPLTYALTKYLRGELPDVPVAEWYEPTQESLELEQQCGEAWATLVESASSAIPTETRPDAGKS
jgi:uncharacterized protein YndB with AHSA1/START domain